MIVASSLDVDKSETLVNLAQHLTVFVRKSVEEGVSLDGLERGVLKRVLHMGQAAVDFFLGVSGPSFTELPIEKSTILTKLQAGCNRKTAIWSKKSMRPINHH